MPFFGIEDNEALKGRLVIRRYVDHPLRDLPGEMCGHRGWLASDEWHIASIGLLGALSDLGLIGCYGQPDHGLSFG
jgi:hypothetical protein